MILLVLHHPRARGWVTSTPTSRKRPAKGAGQPRRAGRFWIECVSFTRSSEGMPSTRLLAGWGGMLRLRMEQFRAFQKRAFKGSLKGWVSLSCISNICTTRAKAWLAGNSWGRQQRCTTREAKSLLK